MTKLEYLTCSNDCYFDTNYYPTTATSVYFKYSYLSDDTGGQYGGIVANNGGDANGVQSYIHNNGIEFGFCGSQTIISGLDLRDVVECEFDRDNLTFNGTSYSITSGSNLTNNPFYINCLLSGNWSLGGNYYRVKFYEDSTLAMDLVPCIDNNNTVCFYDEVGKSYIYPIGSGTPTPGPVIPSTTNLLYIGDSNVEAMYIGDQEVETIYLGSDLVYSGGSTPTPTGVTFVDWVSQRVLEVDPDVNSTIETGLYPTTATTFRVKGYYMGVDNGNTIVGQWKDSDYDDYRLFWASNGNIYFDWGSEREFIPFGKSSGEFVDYTCANYNVYDNVAEDYIIEGTYQYSVPDTYQIGFDVRSWRIQSLEIWEDQTKVFDGKAAVDGNKIGLYDTISNEMFYDSSLDMIYGVSN